MGLYSFTQAMSKGVSPYSFTQAMGKGVIPYSYTLEIVRA